MKPIQFRGKETMSYNKAEHPLPPAEGAEDGMMFTISEDGINPLNDEPTAEGAEEMFRLLAKYASHQRIVDDPDLEKLLELDDMRREVYEDHRIPTDFATAQLIAEETVFRHVIILHAQRIADKMVSERCAKCKYRGLPDSINEALNSGDGVYRP